MINVWATWCGPCVAELPEFVTMNRMYRKRNFQMITISMDEPDDKAAALKMLRENTRRGDELPFDDHQPRQAGRPARPRWEGPVPYTLVIAPGGKVLYRKSGPLQSLAVRRAIVDHLGRTYASRKTN